MTDAAKLAATFRRKERMQGVGLDLALPYLLLAPAVLIVLCVLVYPLWDGLKASVIQFQGGGVVGAMWDHGHSPSERNGGLRFSRFGPRVDQLQEHGSGLGERHQCIDGLG